MPRRERPPRHLGRALVAVLAVVVITFGVATYVLFVRPSTDAPRHADALVVLAGGRGERLTRAVGLVRTGVAPTLVISNGRQPGWRDANRLCDRPQRFRVVCFAPDPQTTRGEAEAIRRLARDDRWTSILVVTSRYHVTRARMLVHRCYGGHTAFVGATPRDHFAGWTLRIVHEWIGLAKALAERGC